MDVVETLRLEPELGPFLESNEVNQITMLNMPELDLGDKPTTYIQRRSEAE